MNSSVVRPSIATARKVQVANRAEARTADTPSLRSVFAGRSCDAGFEREKLWRQLGDSREILAQGHPAGI